MLAVYYHTYSVAWVEQFEIKGTCIEFANNDASPQANNLKIKLNSKVKEIYRNYGSNFFCEINDNPPCFCLNLLEAHL